MVKAQVIQKEEEINYMGIDAGGSNVKVVTRFGVDQFVSDIGEYRDRNLETKFGDDDMIFEYEGKKGFAGSLARFECELGESIKGDTKAHEDAKLRVLLAIHRYSDSEIHNIVVGQPIGTHNEEEKDKIKNMLQGYHELTVNGIKKGFSIERVEVAPEGAVALMSEQKQGIQRVIDIGSGTINCASLNDMRFIDRDSFTIRQGMETTRNKDADQLARLIYARAVQHRWEKSDNVWIVGGGVDEVEKPLKLLFPNAKRLNPKHKSGGKIKSIKPIYANAVGFFEIARRLYA